MLEPEAIPVHGEVLPVCVSFGERILSCGETPALLWTNCGDSIFACGRHAAKRKSDIEHTST